MDSPSMANSHGKQGLDKRHLPDRCIVDSTPYFMYGNGGSQLDPAFGQHMYTAYGVHRYSLPEAAASGCRRAEAVRKVGLQSQSPVHPHGCAGGSQQA